MDNRNHTTLRSLVTGLLLAASLTAPVSVPAAGSFGERLRDLFGGDEPAGRAQDILPAEQAFRFSATTAGPERLNLYWQIADGYYLYRDKFTFSIRRGNASIRPEDVAIPHGTVKQDENFGSVEVNTGEVTIELPLQRADRHSETSIVLSVAYQGCKEDTVCYPPVKQDIAMTLTALPE